MNPGINPGDECEEGRCCALTTGIIRSAAQLWASNETAARKVYCALPAWDVSEVESLLAVFCKAARFDGDLSRWVVSSVTSLYATFAEAEAFRGTGLHAWDVANVTDFTGTFQNAKAFDVDLTSWQTSSATSLHSTFNGAEAFRGVGVSTWDVAKVADFAYTFLNANVFDVDLTSWQTSSATNLYSTFNGAGAFRGVGCVDVGRR